MHFASGLGGPFGQGLEQGFRAADGSLFGIARADERDAAAGRHQAPSFPRCLFLQIGHPGFQALDLFAVLFVQCFHAGDEQAVDGVLLGPEAVGVELEQLPDDFFERHEQRGQRAVFFANGEVVDIHERRLAQTLEVEAEEFLIVLEVQQVRAFRACDAGVGVGALFGLGGDARFDVLHELFNVESRRANFDGRSHGDQYSRITPACQRVGFPSSTPIPPQACVCSIMAVRLGSAPMVPSSRFRYSGVCTKASRSRARVSRASISMRSATDLYSAELQERAPSRGS
jgi:hypothetical protein